MDERWDRVREIVDGLAEVEDANRTAYLERACAGDDALREEVETLMEAGLRDDGFLHPAPVLEQAGRAPQVRPDARIAGYRILRRIASGGMGTVYEAEQDQPRRHVALKTMNAALHTPDSLQRFRYEVEVLGALRHPGIAQIYEAGVQSLEQDGIRHEIPWFAMEYVEDAENILQRADSTGLGLEARLELFATVCDAVAHGHEKGVIHRDLKPDNILVDTAGRPKVIDFGVARVADSALVLATLRTSTGEIVGTLPYMSPEQVRGQGAGLDTRTDVYALSVVLYQLLTGRLPIEVDRSDFLTSARRIQEDLPTRPAHVRPALRGDLEVILLKGLEKDPRDRYASAAALGKDVRRFLAHAPIEARAPTTWYQVRKFARRHRGLVISALLVFGVAIVGTIVSLRFAMQASESEQLASTRADEAEAQEKRATALFAQLLDRNMQATLHFAPRFNQLAGGAPITHELMQATLEDLQRLEKLAEGDPEVQLRLAEAYLELGDVEGNPQHANMGDRAAALARYERAREIVQAIAEADPENFEARSIAAVAQRKRGEMAIAARDLKGAQQLIAEALAEIEAVTKAAPDNLGYRAQLGGMHDKLAMVASRMRDADTIARHVASYEAIFRELHALRPEDRTWHFHFALGSQKRGAAHWRAAAYDKARDGYAESARLLAELSAAVPENVDYRKAQGWSVMWCGSAEQQLGNLDEAEQHLRKALGVYRALQEADPENRTLPPRLGNVLWCLGTVDQDRAGAEGLGGEAKHKHLRAALAWFEQGLAVWEALEREGKLLPAHRAFPAALRERIEAVRTEIDAN